MIGVLDDCVLTRLIFTASMDMGKSKRETHEEEGKMTDLCLQVQLAGFGDKGKTRLRINIRNHHHTTTAVTVTVTACGLSTRTCITESL